ncbi:MAG: hydrogenase formation protein HypD [Bdellovibrionales bacterium]|nr:hydrogenase formation protein HypD [Bdellovibrionales bacterium]
MKFLEEYRNPRTIRALAEKIAQTTKSTWKIMEVCGGQTHSIMRYGLQEILPKEIELIHGPGCPVCVTPQSILDQAIEISRQAILCTFGDMLRVPGSRSSLMQARAEGSDVRVVYSPLDALEIAKCDPRQAVVFLAVGFETTAPANALTVFQAEKQGISNYSLLQCHVRVPPAIEAILDSPDCRVDGFLAAGHVCTIMGTQEYEVLAKKYRVPIVITGFEPVDILEGVWLCTEQLSKGQHLVENQYRRSVLSDGNLTAKRVLEEVFEKADQQWRGLGEIPESGFRLRKKYEAFDARLRFEFSQRSSSTSTCISGDILKGVKKPPQCPEFGKKCTPRNPLGAPMVSSEGACAAYFAYREPHRG